MMESLSITWCDTPLRAPELADFFAGNVGPDYISHAELQGGRAPSPSAWRPDLRDVLRAEMAPRLGLRYFHAREQDVSFRELDHRTVPVGHKGKADTSGM